MGSVLGQACFQVGKNQPLKTLCNNGSKSNWAEVIEGHCTSMFWYRYNGGCFEAVGNNGWGQREVANVGEDLSQLFSTGPKHSARDAIRAGSFMCVHLTQGGTHTSLVESVRGRSSGVSTALMGGSVFQRLKRA